MVFVHLSTCWGNLFHPSFRDGNMVSGLPGVDNQWMIIAYEHELDVVVKLLFSLGLAIPVSVVSSQECPFYLYRVIMRHGEYAQADRLQSRVFSPNARSYR